MVKFLDGPAAGEVLALRRAPFLLRVVKGRKGNWDALDQLGDEPKPSEEVHVYFLHWRGGVVMVDWSDGRGRRGGAFVQAEYRHCDLQPLDQQARDTNSWRSWCRAAISVLPQPQKGQSDGHRDDPLRNGDHVPEEAEQQRPQEPSTSGEGS